MTALSKSQNRWTDKKAAANYGASVVISRQMNEWMNEIVVQQKTSVSAVLCPRVSKNRVREWERMRERDKNRLNQTVQNWTEQNWTENRTQNTEPNTKDWKQTWLQLYNQSKENQGAIQAWREKTPAREKNLVIGRKRILQKDNNNNNNDKDCVLQ